MLLKDYYNADDEIGKTKTYENDILKSMKIRPLFQIKFYNFHNGNKQTLFHIINLVEIYDRCKSREFITSLHGSGLCINYASMKKHRNHLAKFAIANSSGFGLLSPSHFSPSAFTMSAFDNFDHVDQNMLSGKSGSHDTFISLFQEITTKKEMKPKKSEVNLAPVKTLNCQKLAPFSTDKNFNFTRTNYCRNRNLQSK